MKVIVLKSELVFHTYKVMSISSVQSYSLILKCVKTGEVIKNVYLENSKKLYEYYCLSKSSIEKKALQNIVDSMKKHNLV